MALVDVHGPEWQSLDVGPYGKHAPGPQRARCPHRDGPRTLFLVQDQDTGRRPAVTQPIGALTLPGRGGRAMVRGLQVRAATVLDVRQKKRQPSRRCTKSGSIRLRLRPGTSACGRGSTWPWRRWGAWGAAHASSGGYGRRWLITRDSAAPLAVGHVKRRPAETGQPDERHGAFPTCIRLAGGRLVGLALQAPILLGNGLHRRSNAHTSHAAHGAHACQGSRSVGHALSGCMTWSLASASPTMHLDMLCQIYIN